mgnify:CR=1 FL=1
MKAEAYERMTASADDHWWYAGRRAILTEIVKQALMERGSQGARVLDLGCGVSSPVKQSWPGVKTFAADRSSLALNARRAQGSSGGLRCDLTALPFAPRQFDLVLLLDVLEHLDDEGVMLAAIRSLLRPNGALIVTVPAYPFLWSGEDYVSEHRRRYRRDDLRRVIEQAGYVVKRATYFNTWLFPIMAGTILWERTMVPKNRFRSNVRPIPFTINTALNRIFASERWWLRRGDFPFGGSLLCLAHAQNT